MTMRAAEKAGHQEKVVVKSPAVETAPPTMTAEDVKAMLEAQLQAAYEEASSKPAKEVAEPEGWWNLYAVGPIQSIGAVWPSPPPPYAPHQVIRVGERAWVATVLIVVPQLAAFCPPYRINYDTGERRKWQLGPPDVQYVSNGNITGVFTVDVFEFAPSQAGLYEMNISARLYGWCEDSQPPFAGFARAIFKIDPSVFIFEPTAVYDTGLLFQVYE